MVSSIDALVQRPIPALSIYPGGHAPDHDSFEVFGIHALGSNGHEQSADNAATRSDRACQRRGARHLYPYVFMCCEEAAKIITERRRRIASKSLWTLDMNRECFALSEGKGQVCVVGRALAQCYRWMCTCGGSVVLIDPKERKKRKEALERADRRKNDTALYSDATGT